MLETPQAYHDNVKYSFRSPWQQIKRSILKGKMTWNEVIGHWSKMDVIRQTIICTWYFNRLEKTMLPYMNIEKGEAKGYIKIPGKQN